MGPANEIIAAMWRKTFISYP